MQGVGHGSGSSVPHSSFFILHSSFVMLYGRKPAVSGRMAAAGELPAEFREALARRTNRLCGFASPVAWYDAVPSTNDVAERAAASGMPHGTVVAADFQEVGRGRMGRSWFSPPGAGLYVSVVIRPSELRPGMGAGTVSAASSVTLTAGVALAEALRAATGIDAAIKWPNDLVIGWRKVCGILAEGAVGSGGLQHVILGYGINVLSAAYPREIADRATSIETELGRVIDRAAVFAESLACLGERLRELAAGGFPAILDRWRSLSPSSVGHRVQVVADSGWADATTSGIDHDGALLVTDRPGQAPRRVIAGEVIWR
jgi:BirA family transcriptional regulator, biotin operon repressor / biotin---[acetyl-CoA-carboxylase] ligase